IELYDGALVSRDGRSTAVLVGAPDGVDRTPFHGAVRETAQSHQGGGDTLEVVGAPVAEALLGSHILADLGVPPALLGQAAGDYESNRPGLMPLVLAIMALVFLAVFRHPLAALSPVVMIGACLAFTFGVMGWLGIPVYLTTVVLPVILSAVGVADQIHIFLRYRELRRERPDLTPAALAGATMDEMASPVVQISVTTIAGFLSFAFSPLAPVRAFGVFAAVGSLASLTWSLMVIPALLTLAHPSFGKRGQDQRPAGATSRRGFAGLARVATRRRAAVLAGALLSALVAGDGVRRLRVQDSWVDGFAPESRFAQAMRRFDHDFLGTHLLQITVEADPLTFQGEIAGSAVDHKRLVLPARQMPAGADPVRLAGSRIEVRQLPAPDRPAPLDWSGSVESARRQGDRLVLDLPLRGGSPRFWLEPRPDERLRYAVHLEPLLAPAVLRRVGDLEAFLAGRPGVGGVRGPAGYLEATGFMKAPHRPDSRALPDRTETARALWSSYGFVRGPERLRQLVDPEYTRALVTVFLKAPDYAGTRRLMAEVRDYERRHLAPHGLRLGFAGDVAVSQALIGAVVTTQVRSLALSLVGIFAVTALLGRSLRRGLYCVVPPTFAILLSFAAMGWLGIPLGVATSMFAAMTLGIGVDYSIHLLERHRRAREEGLAGEAALTEALAATGPAIAVDTLSVGLGFAVLLLSQVPANARLGGIVALSLVICLAATLVVVPALVGRRGDLRARSEPLEPRRLDQPRVTGDEEDREAEPVA
ncbi:MAG TPA: MMPL family transporter, partial [Thermoanaerobaculia bacterium]|nr:MMPL family transporter [Thermoanaerobaculia bacterium]